MKQQNKKQPLEANTIKKYILHFDINKTIVLQDPDNGMNKEQTFQDYLINMSWGKIDENNSWKAMHNLITKTKPDPELISYREFIEQMYPYKEEDDEPDDIEREKFNQEQQEVRQEFYSNFINVVGQELKTDIEKIIKNLSLNKAVLDELKLPKKLQNITSKDNPLLKNFYDGKCFILPNFYKMMLSLKKAKKEFAIVFRGTGGELNQVVTEFNKFCSGEHPCYNGKNSTILARFDGTKGSKNMIIPPSNLITTYRFNSELEGMQAVFGTLKRQVINRDISESNIEEHYEEDTEVKNIQIQKSAEAIQLKINQLLKSSYGMAISDDYEYYLQQGKSQESGKPLLINQADYQTLQVFFDDEIDEEEGGAVVVKDYITNQTIPIKKSINQYVVKVDILQMIHEPDYFVKAIEICEKARQEEIEKIEKGISDDGPVLPKKSDWEILNELSDGDYLRKTVLPLLCPALQLIDIQRPTDPIAFIAVYLLKNKEKVQLPTPPLESTEQPQEQKEEENDDEKLKEDQEQGEQKVNEKIKQPIQK